MSTTDTEHKAAPIEKKREKKKKNTYINIYIKRIIIIISNKNKK